MYNEGNGLTAEAFLFNIKSVTFWRLRGLIYGRVGFAHTENNLLCLLERFGNMPCFLG
jgi:hypothetical protein